MKTDLIIYVIASVIAVLSVVAIKVYDFAEDSGELNLENLGLVVDQKNITKRKQVGSLAWRKVYDHASLYAGDKIFTEEDSLATLGIGKKSEIDLSELTLMKVDKSDQGDLNLDLVDGFFVASLAAEDSFGSVKVGDGIISMNGENTRFQLDIDENGKKLSVLSGQLLLSQNGKKIEINKDEFVEIPKGAKEFFVESVNYRLLNPKPKEKIIIVRDKKINFRWTLLKEKFPNVKLLISKDRKFEKIDMEFNVETEFLDVLPGQLQGEMYWKLVDSKGADLSFTQNMFILKVGSPSILQPNPSEVIFLDLEKNKTNMITVAWSKNDAEKYEYKLMLNRNGEMISLKQEITDTTLVQFNVALTGKYFVQVRSVVGDIIGDWSSPLSFNIKQVRKSLDAIQLEPADNRDIEMSQNKISFKWQGSEDAPYIVEVAQDIKFEQIVFSQKNYIKNMSYRPTKSGTYFWRVRSPVSEKQASIRKFNYSFSPPVLVTPVLTDFLVESDNYKLDVSWENTYGNNISTYIVEIAKDESFNNIFDKVETRLLSTSISLSAGFSYYLRIGVKGNNNFSEVKKINIKKLEPLVKPKIQKSLKFKFKSTYFKRTIGPYEYLLSPLMASNGSNRNRYIDIKWDKIQSSKKYEVKIYRDKTLDNIVKSIEVKNNSFRWFSPPLGVFFWQIRYIDEHGRKSPFSDISKITIEEETIIKVKKNRTIPYFSQISPRHNISVVSGDKIILSWSKVIKATKYKLYLYEDFDKNKIYKIYSVKGRKVRINIPKGRYHWKVEALNKHKKVIGKTKARGITSRVKVEIINIDNKIVTEKDIPSPQKISDKPKVEVESNSFLAREQNENMKSFFLGGLKPGTYNVDTDLAGSLASSSDDLIMLASFDLYAGLNYSKEYFFEGFYDYKTAGNENITIFDHTYGGIAYKYLKSEKNFNFLYGLGLRHSIFSTELQQASSDSSIQLNYFTFIGKILIDLPLFIFEQRISLELGKGVIAPSSFYYQLSYHVKYYYFKSVGLKPLNNIFIYAGGEYFNREIVYDGSVISITNILGVGGMGIDVKF